MRRTLSYFLPSLLLAGFFHGSVRLGFLEETIRLLVFILLVRSPRIGARSGFCHGIFELWAWLILAPLPWGGVFLLERFLAVYFHTILGAAEGWILGRPKRAWLFLLVFPPLHAAANAFAAYLAV